MEIKLIQGDCLEKLKELPENSVDSIVTDPPYELGFMGKSWDSTGIANNVEMWKGCLRVLKPGGHLLVFSGTRTYHRMASAIEDAGFEVRDMIEWVYGCLSEDTEVLTKDGFKHFHKITQDDIIRVYDTQNDIYKWEKPQRWSQYSVEQDTVYRIKSDTTDQIVSRNHNCIVEREGKLVFVKSEDLLQMERMPVLSDDISILQERHGKILHSELLWQGEGLAQKVFGQREGKETTRNRIEGREEPSVERGSNLQKKEREICRPENQVCEMPTGVSDNGKKRRVCDGTPIESGTGDKETANKSGVCSSHQSRCNGQQDRKLDVIQDERGTQEIRTRTTYYTTLATIEKIEYSGIIFCPTVSTGAFVARRNGQVFITGNSGFPKSLNICKAINKIDGVEFESKPAEGVGFMNNDKEDGYHPTINQLVQKGESSNRAKQWEGWGTALKPAHEPICMARKPLSEKNVAENCLKWGTGGINIDESRVTIDLNNEDRARGKNTIQKTSGISFEGNKKYTQNTPLYNLEQGRFPANLIHDNSEEVRECFPSPHGAGYSNTLKGNKSEGNIFRNSNDVTRFGDSGNASRFFKSIIYQAKASKKDRGAGNNHPTVKPVALMEYLIKMVTPKGGIVLDPFMGSGSTGVACKENGFSFIGIDMTHEYVEIAKARIENTPNKLF